MLSQDDYEIRKDQERIARRRATTSPKEEGIRKRTKKDAGKPAKRRLKDPGVLLLGDILNFFLPVFPLRL